jgi:hypothetical protein
VDHVDVVHGRRELGGAAARPDLTGRGRDRADLVVPHDPFVAAPGLRDVVRRPECQTCGRAGE